MKVILISRKHGGSRSIDLGPWSRAVLSLCCLGLPLGMVAAGYLAGLESGAGTFKHAALDNLQDELAGQADELQGVRDQTQRKLKALTPQPGRTAGTHDAARCAG